MGAQQSLASVKPDTGKGFVAGFLVSRITAIADGAVVNFLIGELAPANTASRHRRA